MNQWLPAVVTIASTVVVVIGGNLFLAGKLVERIAVNSSDIDKLENRADAHDTRLNAHGERIAGLEVRVRT